MNENISRKPKFTYFSYHPSLVDVLLHVTNPDYLAGYNLEGQVERSSYRTEYLSNLELENNYQSLSDFFAVNLLILGVTDTLILSSRLADNNLVNNNLADNKQSIVVVEHDSLTGRYRLIAWHNGESYNLLIPMKFVDSLRKSS